MQGEEKAEATGETRKVGVALSEYREMQSRYSQQTHEEKVLVQPRIVRRFYDAVTKFYEYGWGSSFHFAPRVNGENLAACQRRFQEEVAKLLNLGPGMIVGDAGCGVGGPLLHIAGSSGASVIGLNISELQIRRGRASIRKAGLEDRCDIVQANFMDLPQEESCFDAMYSFEAVCHAPDRAQAFSEIYRTLKPGGEFVIVDWVLTDKYDDADSRHKDVRSRFEYANATPDLFSEQQQVDCIRGAGFEILHASDYALGSDPETPWYFSLEGKDWSFSSLARTPAGRGFTAFVTRYLEMLRIAPSGTSDTAKFLNIAADALVEAGQLGIFTPSYLVHARKPEAPEARGGNVEQGV